MKYFCRFFYIFRGSIKGFLDSYKPYISIDSTTLKDQWNGHMPAALALEGHILMFPLAFVIFDLDTKEIRLGSWSS